MQQPSHMWSTHELTQQNQARSMEGSQTFATSNCRYLSTETYDWVAAWGHFPCWRRPQTCHLWKLALGLYDVQMCSDFDRWETLAHRVGNWPFMVLGWIYGRSNLSNKFGHKFSISSHSMVKAIVNMVKVWHMVHVSRVTWHTWSRWTQRPQEPLVWHLIHVSSSNH